MIRNLTIFISFLLPVCLMGQNQQKSTQQSEISSSKTVSFEDYCKEKAVYFMTVPAAKLDGIKISGDLVSQENNLKASYLDYGIKLSENETQYFTVQGTDKILVAMSLYVLRLNYSNSKK